MADIGFRATAGQSIGFMIGTVSFEGNGVNPPTYSIISGNPNSAYRIGSSDGVLEVGADTYDIETYPVTLVISRTDEVDTVTQTVEIILTSIPTKKSSIIYVDPINGNNSYSGGIQAPVSSLDVAYLKARGGATILLHPGNYGDRSLEKTPVNLKSLVKGSSIFNSLTLVNGQSSVINSLSFIDTGIIAHNPSSSRRSSIIVRGCDFTGEKGVSIDKYLYVSILQNKISVAHQGVSLNNLNEASCLSNVIFGTFSPIEEAININKVDKIDLKHNTVNNSELIFIDDKYSGSLIITTEMYDTGAIFALSDGLDSKDNYTVPPSSVVYDAKSFTLDSGLDFLDTGFPLAAIYSGDCSIAFWFRKGQVPADTNIILGTGYPDAIYVRFNGNSNSILVIWGSSGFISVGNYSYNEWTSLVLQNDSGTIRCFINGIESAVHPEAGTLVPSGTWTLDTNGQTVDFSGLTVWNSAINASLYHDTGPGFGPGGSVALDSNSLTDITNINFTSGDEVIFQYNNTFNSLVNTSEIEYGGTVSYTLNSTRGMRSKIWDVDGVTMGVPSILNNSDSSRWFFFKTTDGGETWVETGEITSPEYGNPVGCAYGNGVWAVVGGVDSNNGAFVWRSVDDGATWTKHQITSYRFRDPKAIWFCETSGLFVVSCTSISGTNIYTSPDCVTWTSRYGTGDESMDRIGFDGQRIILLGSYYIGTGIYIHSSADGITWEKHNSITGWQKNSPVVGENGIAYMLSYAGSTYRIQKNTYPYLLENWETIKTTTYRQYMQIAYKDGMIAIMDYRDHQILWSFDEMQTDLQANFPSGWYSTLYGLVIRPDKNVVMSHRFGDFALLTPTENEIIVPIDPLVIGTSNIAVDPQYTDPQGGNFSLQDTSPNRKEANPSSTNNLEKVSYQKGEDLKGASRSKKGEIPDIGAIENLTDVINRTDPNINLGQEGYDVVYDGDTDRPLRRISTAYGGGSGDDIALNLGDTAPGVSDRKMFFDDKGINLSNAEVFIKDPQTPVEYIDKRDTAFIQPFDPVYVEGGFVIVSIEGDDEEGDGSFFSPYRTISKGLAQPVSIVYVLAGSYPPFEGVSGKRLVFLPRNDLYIKSNFINTTLLSHTWDVYSVGDSTYTFSVDNFEVSHP